MFCCGIVPLLLLIVVIWLSDMSISCICWNIVSILVLYNVITFASWTLFRLTVSIITMILLVNLDGVEYELSIRLWLIVRLKQHFIPNVINWLLTTRNLGWGVRNFTLVNNNQKMLFLLTFGCKHYPQIHV